MDIDARTRAEVSEEAQPKLSNIVLTVIVLVFPPSVKPISDRQYFQVSNLGRILCKIWPSTRYVLGFLSRQPSQVQIVGNLYVWVSKASFDSEWSDSLSASHFLPPSCITWQLSINSYSSFTDGVGVILVDPAEMSNLGWMCFDLRRRRDTSEYFTMRTTTARDE